MSFLSLCMGTIFCFSDSSQYFETDEITTIADNTDSPHIESVVNPLNCVNEVIEAENNHSPVLLPKSGSGLQGDIIAGSSMKECTPAALANEVHAWAKGDATSFHLRIGPNYSKNQRKAASSKALYDLVAVE
jgi:hypothetical protein